jgi:hypothetical protein
MMRKIIVGVAIALTLGTTTLIPTEADARGWRGGGWYGGGWRGAAWRGGWGGGRVVVVRPYRAWAAAPIMVAPVAVSCWRWVPGRWGWVRVWVC